MEYIYTSITAVNLERIKIDVDASEMTDKSLVSSTWEQSTSTLKVIFETELSVDDKALLDNIIANNDPSPLPPEEELVEIKLHQGKDLRQKWLGYQFTAIANSTTNHDIAMPFDGHIQGGHFHAVNSKTGDELSFVIMPDTQYEYAYIDEVPISANETFRPHEEFGVTSLIPVNTPMRIVYKNTDSTDKTIVMKMLYRVNA